MVKALIIFGPSGVGKSTVSKWLAEDLGYIHYEADGGSLDEEMQTEFNRYKDNAIFEPLYNLLLKRAKENQRTGAILSFPSIPPNYDLVIQGEKIGLKSVILFATINECCGSFLIREINWPLEDAVTHWKNNNLTVVPSYGEMKQDRYNRFRVLTMFNGERRARKDVVEEIRMLLER